MHDVWTLGDWDDIETSLLEDIENGEFEMSKPECTCGKLPHERTHAFNCPVQEAIKHCQSPRCSKHAKFTGVHVNGSSGRYCTKCKDMWIERGVLQANTVEHM